MVQLSAVKVLALRRSLADMYFRGNSPRKRQTNRLLEQDIFRMLDEGLIPLEGVLRGL